MGLTEWILILLIAGYSLYVLFGKKKKGCCGDCAKCTGCNRK